MDDDTDARPNGAGYHRTGEPVRHTWDDSQGPSIAVVEAVAATTGRDPMDLPPLQHQLDADALDSLLTSAGPGTSVSVSFEYDGVDVTIGSDGRLEVRTTDPGPS